MKDTSPLVSTEWLEAHRDDSDLILLDASVYIDAVEAGQVRGQLRGGYNAFLETHLPGARFADLLTEFSDSTVPLPFVRPQRRQFEQAAGLLGISPNSHIVIYDALVGQWASRLWWLFHSFGHESVSVLDGGLRKYLAENRQLEQGESSAVKPTQYAAQEVSRRYAPLDDVIAIVEGRKDGQLVCLLLPADYEGTVSVRRRAGHIPSSVNLPFTSLLDKRTNTLLPAEELRAVFSSVVNLDSQAPVITYCGGGIASTLGSLALAVIEHHNTNEFDGSLAEWVLDPARPLALGS